MHSNFLTILSGPICFRFQIKKVSNFSFFQTYATVLMMTVHVGIILFILNSIRNDGIMVIKVLFVIVGLFMLWWLNKKFREFLIFIKGKEEIEIHDSFVHYQGKFGPFKKELTLNIIEIKEIRLALLGSEEFPDSSKMYNQMKHGMIILEKSKYSKIEFGQSLEKHEIENLFAEIEKKIKLPTKMYKS